MRLFRRSRLSPPREGTFIVAVILAAIAVVSVFVRIPWVDQGQHRFWVMAVAFVVLALGTLLDGL